MPSRCSKLTPTLLPFSQTTTKFKFHFKTKLQLPITTNSTRICPMLKKSTRITTSVKESSFPKRFSSKCFTNYPISKSQTQLIAPKRPTNSTPFSRKSQNWKSNSIRGTSSSCSRASRRKPKPKTTSSSKKQPTPTSKLQLTATSRPIRLHPITIRQWFKPNKRSP